MRVGPRLAMVGLVLCAQAIVAAEVTADATSKTALQTRIFYNARLALREGSSEESLKLWLLRNSVVDQGVRATHDPDFHSVVWAALGNLGLCQDGIAQDTQGGAGLWPLAMHNWVLTSVARGGPVENPSPFDAFEAGLQQRFITMHDVLSTEELQSVSFFRTNCWAPQLILLDKGESPWGDLNDRLVTGPIMQTLLKRALVTLRRDKLQNLALIEARLFDLELALAELRLNAAVQEGRIVRERARNAGVSEPAALAVERRAKQWAAANSKQAEFLRRALRWPVRDWLALNRQRRLSLFYQARAVAEADHQAELLEPLMLSMIDELIERKEGTEIESWVGWLDARTKTSRRQPLIQGERGKRLLELDADTGFRERATISLHRGLAFLEAGDLREALISFSFAMKHAESSRDAATTLSLARRWVSYVLARYEVTDDVIATLKALVPQQEYNSVVEDLIWRAALNADVGSFERLVATTRRGSSFDTRVTRLRMLAKGNAGALATDLRDAAQEEPFYTVRFVRLLVEKLEAEELDVRRANVPLIKLLVQVLDVIISKSPANSAQSRGAEELLGRTQALLEALSAFEPNADGKARTLSPAHEAFAGNIRLAPTDPLPWPFVAPEPETPSAFTPIGLTPIEWRDDFGQLVFGWRLSE